MLLSRCLRLPLHPRHDAPDLGDFIFQQAVVLPIVRRSQSTISRSDYCLVASAVSTASRLEISVILERKFAKAWTKLLQAFIDKSISKFLPELDTVMTEKEGILNISSDFTLVGETFSYPFLKYNVILAKLIIIREKLVGIL